MGTAIQLFPGCVSSRAEDDGLIMITFSSLPLLATPPDRDPLRSKKGWDTVPLMHVPRIIAAISNPPPAPPKREGSAGGAGGGQPTARPQTLHRFKRVVEQSNMAMQLLNRVNDALQAGPSRGASEPPSGAASRAPSQRVPATASELPPGHTASLAVGRTPSGASLAAPVGAAPHAPGDGADPAASGQAPPMPPPPGAYMPHGAYVVYYPYATVPGMMPGSPGVPGGSQMAGGAPPGYYPSGPGSAGAASQPYAQPPPGYYPPPPMPYGVPPGAYPPQYPYSAPGSGGAPPAGQQAMSPSKSMKKVRRSCGCEAGSVGKV